MKNYIAASAIGVFLALSAPAMAATSDACKASWSKMDTTNQGFSSDAAAMAKMKSAGLRTAREDQMTDKEYMDACVKDVFTIAK